MPTHERVIPIRLVCAILVAACATFLIAAPTAQAAPEAVGIPTPCDIPGADLVCDAAGAVVDGAASATADFVMRGVTVWVTNAAVWIAGQVGTLIDATASPNVQAGWFQGQYAAMVAVAAALALPLLLLAVIQAVWRQDIWILLRAAFAYLPMAFILAAAAIVATQLLIEITDDLSAMIVSSLGSDSTNLLQSVGDAYQAALDNNADDAIPLFGIFLGAIILAVGAFVLWLEMIIRDAAVYIALFFLPLTFVAMIWPATSRWAKRLVELLVAVVFAKFVVIAIISLASAAITNTTLAGPSSDDSPFERMIAGAALLVLAAWSPFALLRMLPMMEHAAATITSNRSAMSSAAGSAGIQSPAAHMRQAMDRQSRTSTATTSSATFATRNGTAQRPPAARPPATNDATGAGSVPSASRPPASRPAPSPAAASTPAPPSQTPPTKREG